MTEDMKAVTHTYLVTLFKLHKHRVVYLIITRTSFLNDLITVYNYYIL